MSAFDRQKFLLEAQEIKIRRAKTLSKVALNTDWKKAHPDYCRDAQNGNYSVLEKKERESIKAYQDEMQARRDRLVARR